MNKSIKYAKSQIDKFKHAMAVCDKSMDNFYYQKIISWENHLADLKREQEQKMIAR